MKAIIVLILNLAIAALPKLHAQPLPNPPIAGAASSNALSIEWILNEVIAHNPTLRSLRARAEAMNSRIAPAGAWDDPRVGVDIERQGTTRLLTYSDTEWMISQTLPLSGKNRRRAEIAKAEASVSWGEARQRELELLAGARSAFYQFANAHIQVQLNLKSEDLLKQIAGISREKINTGARTQIDVLMAETELAKNSETRINLDRQLWDAQTRLNVLMNHPPESALPRPGELTLPSFGLSLDRLQPMALRHRPELRNAELKIKIAETRHALAKREWFPDPEIRLEARQMNGSGRVINEYDTGIFFNFPWLNRGKYKGAITEAGQMRESAAQELAALQAETIGMVREQVRKIETSLHHYHLFHEKIVPLARQAVEAARASYASDKLGLLELLSLQRSWRESEAAQQQHLVEYLMALAEMETLLGANPNALSADPSPVK